MTKEQTWTTVANIFTFLSFASDGAVLLGLSLCFFVLVLVFMLDDSAVHLGFFFSLVSLALVFCFDNTGCTFAAPDTQDESYLNVIVSLSSGLV